jgi:hypothetical protein
MNTIIASAFWWGFGSGIVLLLSIAGLAVWGISNYAAGGADDESEYDQQ